MSSTFTFGFDEDGELSAMHDAPNTASDLDGVNAEHPSPLFELRTHSLEELVR